MRNLWPALLCLLAACGGNFSNEDLEYLNALPSREALASKLPESSASTLGGGLAQRRDQLALGDVSQLYVDTRKASTDFNASVDGLLSLLENIRTVPPTTREPDRRTWGPWRDDAHPGNDVRFVMDRAGDFFEYHLDYKPSSASSEDAWWTFLEGSFKADAGIRVGEGELHLLIDVALAHGLNVGELRTLKQLDIGYQNKALPTRVEMIFTSQPVPPLSSQQVRYTYRELTGGLGEMRFLLKETDAVPGNLLEDVEITSRWTPNHGGVATFVILRGDLMGASYKECWDAQNHVTFAKRSWEFFGIGKASDCPDLSAFDN